MSPKRRIKEHIRCFISSKALSIELIVTLIVLLAFAVAAARIGHNRQPHSNAAASTDERAGSFYRLNIGERLVYKLDYASTSASDFQKLFSEKGSSTKDQKSAPSALAHSFSTIVQGDLVATVFDRRGDVASVTYSLRNTVVSISANSQPATTEAETVKLDLSRDVFAQVDLQGRVIAVRFDPSSNSLSQSFARALLAVTQFVLPGEQSSGLSQWDSQEDDPAGQYVARYEAQSGNCGVNDAAAVKMFRKTKARYTKSPAKTSSSEFDIPTAINPGGHLMAGFDFNEGRVICLRGKESQTVVMAGRTVAQAETTIGLSFVGKESVSTAELSALRSASAERERVASSVPLSVTPSKEDSEASIQRTELGDATIEDLLSGLAHLEASTDEKKDETTLYLKFKALVYLHPESSTILGEILTTSTSGGTTARILTGALGAVGNAQAQTALATVIRARSEDWPALSMLIPALGSVSLPTQLAEDTLRALASNYSDWNIASTSQLAIGVMARTLAEQSPERAIKLVDWAIKNLESSPSAQATRQWLLVLGNTGSTKALPVIARSISDSSPELRGAAVSALRFIESSQVEELLIKTLAADSDAAVRLEAAVALGFREMTAVSFEAQKKALLRDKAVSVRLAVLKNIWQANEAFPEIRKLVKQAAATDISKEVRKAAAEIMSKLSKGVFKQ